MPPETKARSPRNPSLFAPQAFLHEILRHSHFAIMRLVCSTECKQTANTKEKECDLVVSSHFSGGKHYVASQKTAAEETSESQPANRYSDVNTQYLGIVFKKLAYPAVQYKILMEFARSLVLGLLFRNVKQFQVFFGLVI